MIGKIRQKMILHSSPINKQIYELICPICERPIPDSQKDAHHLVPKSKGGKTTEYLHRICHQQIHAHFTETELAKELNNASSLRNQAEIKKFISWVKSKPNYFYEKTRKSARLKIN
ncbi:HNH endonuclease [Polynucleobacter sp. IMCC30063]|uniref:HNH endonuclease n=1 Tax=unclassified Polynucleobacter TaxID=2640945 RepID=UPI001F32E8FC|nr:MULTISPECIES: HNH endonuclease signature motif containing protein [unclassified Polynucleobacter]MCE7505516.1 HNH endonuclease [Polynucleobacter sp. IMCC30063]MCE7528214.1 HNH endonuclease [Polynucleobacter sp. IMCC 30228]MCE7530320.1 HNH endonuclease [Polynucleobacter sp. IMCC 29146]